MTSIRNSFPPVIDAEYARVFGTKLAVAHGARLRAAALDTEALMALLDFTAPDRVALFKGLGIPFGQAVQLSAALERNVRSAD